MITVTIPTHRKLQLISVVGDFYELKPRIAADWFAIYHGQFCGVDGSFDHHVLMDVPRMSYG